MKKILVALALIPILIWVIWIAIPESFLRDTIENSLSEKHFRLETEGLKKNIFFKFTIDRLTLKGFGKEQVSFQNIQAPIMLPAFIRLKLNIKFHGDFGRGNISGDIIRTLHETKIHINFENAHISDLPFLNHAGISGSGMLSGNLTMADSKGDVEFVTHDAQFQPVVLSDIILPLNLFNSARGALEVRGNVMQVTSLSLEGRDIYARLKGKIDSNFIDFSMEIMPERPFLENPLFFNTLERYKISPGYYVVHVKKKLRSLKSL